jgi:hypothetical protein
MLTRLILNRYLIERGRDRIARRHVFIWLTHFASIIAYLITRPPNSRHCGTPGGREYHG